MSIRIATATANIPRMGHKAPKVVGIAVLLAATLTANIADAAHMSHYRQFRASMPESGRAAAYAPGFVSRHDRGIPAPLPVAPLAGGHGIFQETIPAP